jgi:hypothetical protein
LIILQGKEVLRKQNFEGNFRLLKYNAKEVYEMEEVNEQLISLPRLGEPAPAFEAVTTHGVLKLGDFKGSWLVLLMVTRAQYTLAC